MMENILEFNHGELNVGINVIKAARILFGRLHLFNTFLYVLEWQYDFGEI
ncbi:MAG: hypothetical protein WBA22_09370 [Candidatus Methanofastidiosia archaeon]